MDVNIPEVTNGQQQQLTALNGLWQPIKNEYTDLQTQVTEFNALCRSLSIEKITIPALVK
ncbi:MAG: hypothetical protein WKF59_04060 [Chitinophagaceae bacterium]